MKGTRELTEIELEQIARRAAAASVGPWFSWVPNRNMEAGCSCIELGSCALMQMQGGTVEDQEFIACAREDVPRLVDEVRRLRARVDRLSAEIETRGVWQRISQASLPTRIESTANEEMAAYGDDTSLTTTHP